MAEKTKKQLTKAEFTAMVKIGNYSSNVEALKCVNSFIDGVARSLEAGNSIAIPNLGIFEIRDHTARLMRNPKTGESMTIEARKRVSFKISKNLQKKSKMI